ncbi:hypothetical protein M405DRAFT_804060, partial [Rhizopogon salebrosus TDB-379]
MQYSWLTVFLVAFGVVAPVLAAPLENAHYAGSARAHGLKAKHLAARDNSTSRKTFSITSPSTSLARTATATATQS